jgi:hypothetical protein
MDTWRLSLIWAISMRTALKMMTQVAQSLSLTSTKPTATTLKLHQRISLEPLTTWRLFTSATKNTVMRKNA